MATLTRKEGRTIISVLNNNQVAQLIKTHEEEEAKVEAEKKKESEKKK